MVRIPPQVKYHFLRWHRRFGIFAALFILVLAITGILLNHSSSLSLDQQPVSRQLQKWFYGIDFSVIATSNIEDGVSFTQLNDQTVYMNSDKAVVCEGDMLGANSLQSNSNGYQGYLLWCMNELVLLSKNGNIEERLGAFQELPTPLNSVGHCADGAICFESSKEKVYEFSTEKLTWSLVDQKKYVPVKIENAISKDLLQEIESKHIGHGINLERMILDFHSGRLFGAIGVWLVDIIGVLIILLALSGLFLWFGRRRR